MTTVVDQMRLGPAEMARQFGVGFYREAYAKGLTVSQLCEREHPTANLPQAERTLDAFERVLKEAQIVTVPNHRMGLQATKWEDIIKTPEKRAMLHEWASRIWKQSTAFDHAEAEGINGGIRTVLTSQDAALNSIINKYQDDDTIRAKRLVPPIPLDRLVARTTRINGDSYRTLYVVDDLATDAYRLKRVVEGAEIPRTSLVTGEHYFRVHKFGRALQATYEQLRRQTIDRIAFIIARMALQAEVDKVSDLLNVVLNGDGNANTSATVYAGTALDAAMVAGTLTLKAWLDFKLKLSLGYNFDVVLGQEASILQTLLLPVGTVSATPLVFLGGGNNGAPGEYPNTFGGLNPLRQNFGGAIGYGVTAAVPALKLIALDSSLAVERVIEVGGNISEVERFVLNQTEVLTITEVEGFGIFDPNAMSVLNINA